MELHADEPWMIGELVLGKRPSDAGEHKALLFQSLAVGGVNLIAVTMARLKISVSRYVGAYASRA